MSHRVRSSLALAALGLLIPCGCRESGPPTADAAAGAAAPIQPPSPALVRPAGFDAAHSLRVLFLGDDGHHQPLARASQVAAPLRERGIDLHYTASLDALSPEGLSGYHALLVYANHPTIGRAQEQALLAFVRAGGGLVAVHSASACFANSPAWVELVGARFERHGSGTFGTERTAPGHPLLQGFAGFTSWDETYVHTRHNPDRTVLEERVDDAGREPWSWVRQAGAGRVFYTAWGHDQRTWGHAGFQDLLCRGIRWAAGDPEPARPPPVTPFTQVTADSPIPDYRPGRPWGESEQVHTMQAPLDPAASLRRVALEPGLRLELFAAEPDLQKPIAMCWDARGRLFVAETVDYPNDAAADGKGRDRIRLCADTDGDGRADRFTTFADGLSIPTGLCWHPDGLVVAQAPDLLLLRDTDGDYRADARTVLVTGFGTGDTHAGPSNLRLGFDGRIWGTVGYSGFRGTVAGDERRFGSGIWAIGADGRGFEFLGATTNNTWGLGFDEAGNVFASTANGNPSVHLAIPHRHYEAVPGLAPGTLPTIADRLAIHPITAGVRQVDFHGQFTAGAGHAIYTARALPRRFWNRAALVAEPTGHLVACFLLEPAGSGFVARSAWNLLASDDQWTAPIQAEVGPDGAVWVIDWYNYIVQHNPTPHGFTTGKGNAYQTPLRDKRHGRIWRIVAEGAAAPPARDLARASGGELVRALDDDNLHWRLIAQALLVRQRDAGLDRQLLARAGATQLDALGLDPGALHALWALHQRGALGDGADAAVQQALLAALRHPTAAVRATAWQVLPPTAEVRDLVLDRGLLDDRDPKVRLHALLALGSMPPSDRAGRAVFALASRPAEPDDPWLPDALTIAAARHAAGFLAAALAAARPDPTAAATSAPPRNLLQNADCEAGTGDQPDGWRVRTYSGRGASHAWTDGGRGGGRCLMIRAERGTDTSWHQDVAVEPGRSYRLQAWIRTANLARVRGGMGALLNVHGRDRETHTSNPVHGDSDWTLSTLTFDSGRATSVSINCLYGGWGQATGTAWFDDLELVAIDTGMPGPLGRMTARVTQAFASGAEGDAVVELVLGLRGAEPAVARSFLDGLAAGWPPGRTAALEPPTAAALAALARALDDDRRAALLLLCDRMGVAMALAADATALRQDLRRNVADDQQPVPQRLRAAGLLVALADDADTTALLAGLLQPEAPPALSEGLVQALATSTRSEVGAELLRHWPALGPGARQSAVAALCQRAAWSRALLAAIAGGELDPAAVPGHLWQILEQHPDAAIAEQAMQLHGRPAAEHAALVAALLPAAERPGDARAGLELFRQHCATCHRLGGQGGAMGPPLDGLAARPRRETLLAILDPNQSVEANYLQWVVTTRAGQVHSGRLDAETRTTVELLDLQGRRQVIARGDISSMASTGRSLMPATFHLLGEQGLADLLECLTQPEGEGR